MAKGKGNVNGFKSKEVMVTQERKTTESGTPYYELTFTAISENTFSEDDIKKVVDLIRELEQKNS